MLENGLDLEQVYRDQDPHFFIEKGIKNLPLTILLDSYISETRNVE
jgi:hypothetical protein